MLPDHRLYRALNKPTDIEVEVDMAAVDDEGDEAEMQPKDASLYRAIFARLNCLAQDRLDL